MAGPAASKTSARAVRFAFLAIVLLGGWTFILWQNRFYATPAVVFAMLGFFAVVMTTYNLWRTGAAAVAVNDEDDGDEAWGKPIGEREELDKEKRTLVKAIKEAEFDLAMKKLSEKDANEMIATYRARAIEVIKEIERLEAGDAGTVRERIEREVKARVELDAKRSTKKKKDKGAPVPQVVGDVVDQVDDAPVAAKSAVDAADAEPVPEALSPKPEAQSSKETTP